MANNDAAQRLEALMMALLALTHRTAAQTGADPDADGHIFKILSRGGIKGAEIAQIFRVSEATVSRRLRE